MFSRFKTSRKHVFYMFSICVREVFEMFSISVRMFSKCFRMFLCAETSHDKLEADKYLTKLAHKFQFEMHDTDVYDKSGKSLSTKNVHE